METLTMNAKERRRLTVFSRVRERAISVAEAGRLLSLSERQARRLWKRYREKGDGGLIHGLRGRGSNAGRGTEKLRVLALVREKYVNFSAAHAAEFLVKDKIRVPRNTLWRWLKAAGLIVNARKVKPHRKRRERRSCVGALVQMDGSTHHWFGPEFKACVLFVMIDDASSRVFARFYASEDTATAFDLFGRYARSQGLPLALYVDHDSIYTVNDAAARHNAREAGRQAPLTQFGRAMKSLGVEVICAHSPQAKGRVERVNRTFQDRLVKELKLHGIRDIPKANVYLEKKFLKSLNELISVAPAGGANVHRPVPEALQLENVLCHQEPRSVGQDWCVRYAGRILQIEKKHEPLALAGRRIDVLEGSDGRLQLIHQGRPLLFTQVVERPQKVIAKKPPPASGMPWRPGPDHYWNRHRACGRKAKMAAT
jgi:transposase